jgi:FAD/FMN-containing dehydrogenase
MQSSTSALSIPKLRAAISGRVIGPEDSDYDDARMIFMGGVDSHPAVIVRVADADDVSQVVSVARDTGMELAIRSGGHSGAAHSTSEGGIVIDLSDMKALDIDIDAKTAWAETGLTAGEYSQAVAAHGLATGFGDTASVGIGGLTVGGGIGYLVRKYGLTIDDLLAAEVVTADGEILHVDADSHPDLFWAIRGGGGNFGVATRFQLRLHEVDSFVGGMMLLPATAETIKGFLTEADAAPDELSTIANVMPAPPMPFVPEEHHGKIVIMALMAYAGPADEGERVLAPFRALAEPIVDMVRPIPYPEIYPPDDESYHPIAAARTMFVDAVDDSAIDTILEYLQSSTAMMQVAQIRILGGAMARVSNDATAFAHRDRAVMINVAALYESPDQAAPHEKWVDDFVKALRKEQTGVYVNFLGNEGAARVREAYPGSTWDRLVEIKRRYDPNNLFRLNQNIPPSN